MDLFVDIQLGQTAALGVVSHADGHRLGALGDRHCDLKELQKEQKTEELVRDKWEKKSEGRICAFCVLVKAGSTRANGSCDTYTEV